MQETAHQSDPLGTDSAPSHQVARNKTTTGHLKTTDDHDEDQHHAHEEPETAKDRRIRLVAAKSTCTRSKKRNVTHAEVDEEEDRDLAMPSAMLLPLMQEIRHS